MSLWRECRQALKRRGGLWSAARQLGWVRLLDQGLRLLWLRVAERGFRGSSASSSPCYGLREAVLFPCYDYWLRHARVAEQVKQMSNGRVVQVLEVASGRGGLGPFLSTPGSQLCLVDQRADFLAARQDSAWRVCADACRLPFADRAFDVAVSIDTVEHLPRAVRPAFLAELKRVCRHGLVVTCPIESGDGRFGARQADLALQRSLLRRGQPVDNWLSEHIQAGQPTDTEMLSQLPGAKLYGVQNCQTWLDYQALALRPFLWVLAGFFYWLRWQKRDAMPPFWRGILVWHPGGNTPSSAGVQP